MKVAVIIGSLRKDSYNRKVFKAYKELARNSEVEFVEVHYHDFPIYNEEIENAKIPDSVTAASEQLHSCKALLVFSPEYNYSIPGGLKNALDWFSRLKNSPVAQKPTSILGASPGKIGTARMQYDFRKIAVALNMNVLTKPEVLISEVHTQFDEEGKLQNEKTKEILSKHLESFKTFVAKNS